jgi:hypothetical protein
MAKDRTEQASCKEEQTESVWRSYWCVVYARAEIARWKYGFERYSMEVVGVMDCVVCVNDGCLQKV